MKYVILVSKLKTILLCTGILKQPLGLCQEIIHSFVGISISVCRFMAQVCPYPSGLLQQLSNQDYCSIVLMHWSCCSLVLSFRYLIFSTACKTPPTVEITSLMWTGCCVDCWIRLGFDFSNWESPCCLSTYVETCNMCEFHCGLVTRCNNNHLSRWYKSCVQNNQIALEKNSLYHPLFRWYLTNTFAINP